MRVTHHRVLSSVTLATAPWNATDCNADRTAQQAAADWHARLTLSYASNTVQREIAL